MELQPGFLHGQLKCRTFPLPPKCLLLLFHSCAHFSPSTSLQDVNYRIGQKGALFAKCNILTFTQVVVDINNWPIYFMHVCVTVHSACTCQCRYVQVCMHMCVHVSACGGQRPISNIVPQHFSLNLQLINSARLAGHSLLGMCLSLPPTSSQH